MLGMLLTFIVAGTTPPPATPEPVTTPETAPEPKTLHGDARLTFLFGTAAPRPGAPGLPSGGAILDVSPSLSFGDFEVRLEHSLALSQLGVESGPAVFWSDTLVSGGWRHPWEWEGNTVEPVVRVGYALPISPSSISVGSVGGLSAQARLEYHRPIEAVVVGVRVGVDGALHPLRLAPLCRPDGNGGCLQGRGPAGGFRSDQCPPGAIDALFRHACSPSPSGAVGAVGGVDVTIPAIKLALGVQVSSTQSFLPPLANPPELRSEFASDQNRIGVNGTTARVSWSPIEHLTVAAGAADVTPVFAVDVNGGSQVLRLPFVLSREFFVEVIASL